MTRDSPRGDRDDGPGRPVQTSRRRFLAATGAAGLAGVGGAGGFALAQEDGETTYEFGGEIAGWIGEAPADVEGETNPTLELEAGTEYEVVWENLDGQPHDFVILDDEGEEVAGTEIMSDQGETLSFTFTASEEMSEYVCTVHPTSMVGEIQVGEADDDADGEQRRYVPEGPTVGAELVADGPLVNPVTLRTVPGEDDAHVVVDQVGTAYLLEDDELRDEPFLDLADDVVVLADTGGEFERSEGFDERGLLGMDFHPEFEDNGLFYVRYSAEGPAEADRLVGPGDRQFPDGWDHVEVLAEFEVDDAGDDLAADPDSERVLLEVPQPQFNHNAGEVTFGPDGYLYTSLGDGGGANDTHPGHVDDWYDGNDGGNAQAVTENLLGTVVRIDVDGGASETPQEGDGEAVGEAGEDTPYAVPDDNPLVDTEGFDEIFAWGLRNPWRMSFDGDRLIAADVGQALFEEVDVIESGGNYGWNVREGFHCFDADDATEPPEQCPRTAPDEEPYDGQELLDPVLEYPHSYEGTPVGISITGGYTYQGDELSDLDGRYVFGDWSRNFAQPDGRVFVATPDEADGAASADVDGEGGANETAGDEADDVENVTVGQQTGDEPANVTGDGNATNGNATAGNESGDESLAGVDVEEDVTVPLPENQPWTYEEVLFDGGEGEQLNRFIQAFGRDDDGDVYVLASRTGRLTTEAGEVFRLVSAGEGDEISQPEVEIPTGEDGDDGDGDGGGNETTGSEADDAAGDGADGAATGNETGNNASAD